MSQKRAAKDSHGEKESGADLFLVNGSQKQKRSSSTAPSSSNICDTGGRGILNNVSSILSHPLCLPLFYYLNDDDMERTNDVPLPLYRKPLIDVNASSAHDSIFSDALQELQNEHTNNQQNGIRNLFEKDITKKIVKKINASNDSFNRTSNVNHVSFIATREENVGEHGRPAFVDMMFTKKQRDESNHTLMLLEFAIGHEQYYKKLNQLDTYLQKTPFEKHILMAVVTIETTIDENYTSMYIGLFFCQKRHDNSNDIRKTLLWQSRSVKGEGDGDGVLSTSNLFGKLLKATENYIHWIENPSNEPYQYFSSNCCKICDQVYRVYDDRCRDLYRTPTVYLDCDDFDTNLEASGGGDTTSKKLGKKVFTMKTKPLIVNNNDKYNNADKTVTVISTPYRKGEHWTTYPKSFIPIIDQIIQLHKKNIVHGDIRAYNIIFTNNNDRQGWLIDFDFGGKCAGKSRVTYPPGYVSALNDGQRVEVPRGEIRKWHDWFALGQLIFIKHTFEPPKNRKIDESTELLLLKKEKEMFSKWTKYPEGEDTEIKYDVKELKDFLNDYETNYGFTLRPNIPLKLEGTSKQQEVTKTCKEATSSPPNKKI